MVSGSEGSKLMDKNTKIEEIIAFVTAYPESTASRAILRRHYINKNNYETANELSLQLKDVLKKEESDEINFCFYLVK